MDSPTEKQFTNAIQRLKTQMKEMQELFETQDEEKHQEIQSLLKERKELKEKIELLETKISDSHNNSSSLASTTFSPPPSSSPLKHETTSSSTTDSGCCGSSHVSNDSHEMMYVEEYEKLQESHQQLFDEKTYLEAKVHEMTSCLKHLQETAEDLQQKSNEQQELVQKLVAENQSLTFTNKDLYEAVTEMKSQKNEAVEEVDPLSLFEQLREAGYMEELKQKTVEQEELIQRLVAENQSLTSTNKDLCKAVMDLEQQKIEAADVVVTDPSQSLVDELPEAGYIEELKQKSNDQQEVIQRLVAENQSLTLTNKDLCKAVTELESLKNEAVVAASESSFEELQQDMEELKQKSNDQQEVIQKLVAENQRLTFTNKDLCKAVTEMESQKNEVVVAAPESSFEELQQNMEELKQKNIQQEEMIQKLIAENQSLTSTNKDLCKAVMDSKQQKNETAEVVVAAPNSSLLLIPFVVISLYVFFCIYTGLPILHFISPDYFHTSRKNDGMVPM